MIKETSGDLLAAKVDALVNTVNTVGVMGKGIALQFKRRYPANYETYRAACQKGEVKIGEMFVVPTNQIDGPRWIVNFPTKRHWKSPSKIGDVILGLSDLVRVIEDLGLRSIAIPPLGAGNGGLNWAEVKPHIRAALADLTSVEVLLFEPTSDQHSLAPKPIRLTPARALILNLMTAYVERRNALEPWADTTGVSHLEIQKLMYFASKCEPTLSLRYEEGRYGPYSDVVRAMLSEMEGWYTLGFGDGSKKSLELSPISPTPRAEVEIELFLRSNDARNMIERVTAQVMHLVEGFEAAYALELLASADWAASRAESVDPETVAKYVSQWSPRKRRIFTTAHVAVAVEHLVAFQD